MTTFDHPPKILFLYGSLRERSYSRRTGTMLASYLGVAGLFYDDAIQTIQTANPEVE